MTLSSRICSNERAQGAILTVVITIDAAVHPSMTRDKIMSKSNIFKFRAIPGLKPGNNSLRRGDSKIEKLRPRVDQTT